MANNTTYS